MRSIQSNALPRGVVLAVALLVAQLGAPAQAEDVEIVTGVVPAEQLADMLYVERPRTRSIGGAQPERPTIAFMVRFAFDSAEILPESRPQLDALGSMLGLEKVAGKALRIEGHTDSVGSRAYNQSLSERRARAVARYLADGHGIDPSRLMTSGRGEARPLEGRDGRDPMNRRVQFQAAE